jgi:hypothetical protein
LIKSNGFTTRSSLLSGDVIIITQVHGQLKSL